MRGALPGLASPHPIGELLPSCLQEDEFAMRWTAGFDDVLAPVFSVLDCLEAYVDPRTAPADFLEWIAGWVGASLDEHWEPARSREAVMAAVALHRMRGTAAGLRAQLEVASGGRVEIEEPGGVSWSDVPSTGFPDLPRPLTVAAADPELAAVLRVRVAVPDPDAVPVAALEALTEAAKPAHLPHTIEVVRDDRLP